ncbi:MAG TPA: YtfJ family protein [Myxococcota bacterium]|nr:YtfJ family protein [Myxococcota bacterium]HOA13806.1 YtfJ family protein [Myxococcota bacterium]HOC99998.1 YtfJ family protein [Myxococcota bacterium]HOH76909.1 YtfJ family protein [Myxococcota bacterium]HPV03104.1 YtfJ family protein [Myxococcota bacterium]
MNSVPKILSIRGFIVAAALVVAASFVMTSTVAVALNKGDTVSTVTVKDSKDKDAQIPDIGSKVLAIFYTDPDVQNQNEPFRELLNKSGLDLAKFRGLGVVNMKDTLLANAIIRSVVRGKEKKFNSLILTDPSHLLKNAWNLGDANGKDIVIIIGKDKKVHYIKAGKMTEAEQQKGLELIRELCAR